MNKREHDLQLRREAEAVLKPLIQEVVDPSHSAKYNVIPVEVAADLLGPEGLAKLAQDPIRGITPRCCRPGTAFYWWNVLDYLHDRYLQERPYVAEEAQTR